MLAGHPQALAGFAATHPHDCFKVATGVEISPCSLRKGLQTVDARSLFSSDAGGIVHDIGE